MFDPDKYLRQQELREEKRRSKVITTCSGCGEDIFAGEDVIVTETGDIFHDDINCVFDYLGAKFMTAEEAVDM